MLTVHAQRTKKLRALKVKVGNTLGWDGNQLRHRSKVCHVLPIMSQYYTYIELYLLGGSRFPKAQHWRACECSNGTGSHYMHAWYAQSLEYLLITYVRHLDIDLVLQSGHWNNEIMDFDVADSEQNGQHTGMAIKMIAAWIEVASWKLDFISTWYLHWTVSSCRSNIAVTPISNGLRMKQQNRIPAPWMVCLITQLFN